MATTSPDVWACSSCRSINGKRADRCYRCHTPRRLVAVKPADMPFEAVPTPAPTGRFRSSSFRAVLVSFAVLALIASAGLATWSIWSVTDLRIAEGNPVADDLLRERLPFLLAFPLFAGVALVAYAAWISRVVDNLPVLGAGYSAVGPRMAIVEAFLPGLNVVTIVARTGEVLRKLEGVGRGMALLGLACFVWFPPLAGGALILRFGRFVETGEQRLRTFEWLTLAFFVCGTITLLIGLVVVWRIERLCHARAGAAAMAPSD